MRVARRVKETHPDRETSSSSGMPGRAESQGKRHDPGVRRREAPLRDDQRQQRRAAPGYLREAIAHFRDPSVGMVTHLVRGIGAKTLGARLENQHLNSFILPSVSLLDRMFSMPCVVGKSMLMRRDLDGMGGLGGVKDYPGGRLRSGGAVPEGGEEGGHLRIRPWTP